MSEKKRVALTVFITAVTSPVTVKRLAEKLAINAQEVFVRVNFKLTQDEDAKEYQSSNKLRFFGQEGYQTLLNAKETGDPVSITLTMDSRGSLMYLNSDEHVEVADLFSTPVEKVDNRSDVSDLF